MGIDPFNPVGSAINSISRTSRITDLLTNYRFHVMDVSFTSPQVFSLSYGFSQVTAPEVTVHTKEVKEGTFEYPRKIVQSATVTDIVLHRGVRFFDSDFSDWIKVAIKGTSQGISFVNGSVPAANYRKNLLLIQYSDVSTDINIAPSNSFFSFQTLNSLVQMIPARAWMLYECIPVNYKSGSDFDSLGAQISVAEVTIAFKYFDEYSTGL